MKQSLEIKLRPQMTFVESNYKSKCLNSISGKFSLTALSNEINEKKTKEWSHKKAMFIILTTDNRRVD